MLPSYANFRKRCLVTPTCIQRTQQTDLNPHLDFSPENRSNILIFPEDQLTEPFSVDKRYFSSNDKGAHTYQYPRREDFCKNILAMRNRSCIHIVSNDELDIRNFKSILHETAGRSENIIFYRWYGTDLLVHANVVYIDKINRRIHFMPDDNELEFESTYSADLIRKFRKFQTSDETYSLCFPVGAFFKKAQRIQKDYESCSFMSHQFAQKLEHMNSSSVDPTSLFVIEDFKPFMKEIEITEQETVFKFTPFYEDNLFFTPESVDLETLFSVVKAYVFPFPGVSQRRAPLVLNHALFQECFPRQDYSVYNRTDQKKASRTLWELYFEFQFEPDTVSKCDKAVERLYGDEAYKREFSEKTSHIRKLYDLSLISLENKEMSIQIAKEIFQLLSVNPKPAFFEKIGVTLDSEEHHRILDQINDD